MVHVAVPVAQLLLKKDLERFGELLGDVRKGDVLHPAGFDELSEIELRGLRLAVGRGPTGTYYIVELEMDGKPDIQVEIKEDGTPKQ